MNYFDTHAYIGLIKPDDPIEQLLASRTSYRAGVKAIINISNTLNDFFQFHKNLVQAENVYFAAGISPVEAHQKERDWEVLLNKAASMDKVIAIGETGLDNRYDTKEIQVELFLYHLKLANRLQKPVIIHNKDSSDELFSILKNQIPEKGAVLHCFSDKWPLAKKALDNDLFISFAGNCTYKSSDFLNEVIKKMPIEKMLVESEVPFMVPVNGQGSGSQKKRNEKPSNIKYIIEHIARVRNENEEEIANKLFENSSKLFQLKFD